MPRLCHEFPADGAHKGALGLRVLHGAQPNLCDKVIGEKSIAALVLIGDSLQIHTKRRWKVCVGTNEMRVRQMKNVARRIQNARKNIIVCGSLTVVHRDARTHGLTPEHKGQRIVRLWQRAELAHKIATVLLKAEDIVWHAANVEVNPQRQLVVLRGRIGAQERVGSLHCYSVL